MPSEIRWEPMGDHAYRWHSDWWVPDGSIEEVGEGFLGVEIQYGRVAHGPDEGTWAVWVGFDHATHGDRKMVGLTEDEAKRRSEVLVRAIREVWPEGEMLVMRETALPAVVSAYVVKCDRCAGTGELALAPAYVETLDCLTAAVRIDVTGNRASISGWLTASEVAEACAITVQAATNRLQRLRAWGLVRRRPASKGPARWEFTIR